MSQITPAKRKVPYAQVAKTLLDDDRLSWSAKGVAAYLVGKPPGWKMRISDLVNRSTDGKHSVRAAVNELRKFGYAKFTRTRIDGKIQEGVWEISDLPEFEPHTENQVVDLPRSDFQEEGNQEEGNQHHSKNDSNKIDGSKNDFAKEASKTIKTPPNPSPNRRAPLPDMPEDWRDELSEPWARFLRHCAERNRPVTPTQAATIFEQWEEIPSYAEIKSSIDLAITTGNTGLIRPKKESPKKPEQAPAVVL